MQKYKPRKRVPVRPQKSIISYILPFLIIIGLGILGVFVYDFFTDTPESVDPRTANAKVFVTLEEGADTKVQLWGKNENMTVKNDSIIYAGDTVIADGTAPTILKFENGTILRLAPQTELTIDNITSASVSHISTKLTSGNVWANIPDKKFNFILKMPHTIFTAKAGMFDAGISEGGYETVNDIKGEGEVSVVAMTEKGRIDSIAKYPLTAGQTFILDEEKFLALTSPAEPVEGEEVTELIYVAETPSEYLESNWYKTNFEIDNIISEREGDTETPDPEENPDTPAEPALDTDPTAVLTITSHSSGESTGEDQIQLVGGYNEQVKSITVNKKPAILDGAGEWVASVDLESGQNKISLKAYSANDKVLSEKTITISLDNSAPEIPTFTQPEAGETQTDSAGVVIKGTVDEDTYKVGVTDSTSNKEYLLSAYIPGSTTWGYNAKKEYANLSDGENTYTVIAYDKAGNASESATLTFTYSPELTDTPATDIKVTDTTEPDTPAPAEQEPDTTPEAIPGIDDSSSDPDTIPPTEPASEPVETFGNPAITIPTSAGTFQTSLEEVALGGTATVGTAQILLDGTPVNYSEGSTRWSQIVSLQDGANIFTIKSISTDGEISSPVSITITKE